MAPPRTLYTYTHFGMYKETRCCRSTFRHKWVTSFPSSSNCLKSTSLLLPLPIQPKSFHVSPSGRSSYEKKSCRFVLVLAVWCSRFSYTLFNSLENKIKGKDEVVKLTFKFWIRNFMPALMYCTDINSSQYDLYKMTLYPAHTSDRAFFQRQGRPQKSQQEAKILCQPPPSYPSSPTSIPVLICRARVCSAASTCGRPLAFSGLIQKGQISRKMNSDK